VNADDKVSRSRMRTFRSYSVFNIFSYLFGRRCAVGSLSWDRLIPSGESAAHPQTSD